MKRFFLIPLLTLLCTVMVWGTDITDGAALKSFLEAAGTAEATVTEDVDISSSAITMKGTKTLTINEGVTVYYLRQSSGPNIKVPTGTSLTLLGSGTIRPLPGADIDQEENPYHADYYDTYKGYSSMYNGNRPFDIYGTLVVGVANDASNQPHIITTSICRGAGLLCQSGANVTINNINMHAGYTAITVKSNASVTINGGYIESVSSKLNDKLRNDGSGAWWSYTIGVAGQLNVNDGTFVGVHGGLEYNSGAIGEIRGGSFYTQPSVGVSSPDNFYALYVSTNAVVNVYGGRFKVELPSGGANRVISIGDNDAGTTFGIINLYGGLFQQKPYLSHRKAQDAEVIYPASIPLTSQWYSSFGTNVPMPAGYEYYETGNATYPWGVRAIPGTATEEAVIPANPEVTIPWQKETTWVSGDVPEDNTIVTIPARATVVVSAGEAVKNAEAEQVFINQGASLTVENGTSLTIGDGGLNIGNGGSLTVEPGATVKIGSAGVITTEEEALVLESTEDAQAILLYNPAVTENTQPKATVKLTTKSKMLAGDPTWQYTYQRFAIPVKEAMIPANDFDPDHDELFPGEEAYGFESYVYYWTGHNWATTTWTALAPFKGYQLANNSKNGGVTYTFNGNLFGNEDKAFEFQESGFDYFGNSYTAPINVESFLSGFGADVEATIWLYNYDTKNWQQVALEDIEDGFVEDEFKQIKSMDGFLLNLRAASGSAPVDYASAIWANPLLPAHAPARNKVTNEINNSAVITVKDNAGFGDNLTLVEKDKYTNAFENGADATKYILAEGVSLYAETQEGKLGRMATNDLDNTIISFRSGDNSEYTLTLGKVNGEDYLLRDNATGMTMAIAEGATYTFTQEANTTVPARFEIISIAKMPTAIENIEVEAKAHGIYNVAGQFLGNDFTVLPAGVYVVNGVKIVK